jgi:hypothetical protein
MKIDYGENCIMVKLVRLIKMCLNKIFCKFHIGKHLSDAFLVHMV